MTKLTKAAAVALAVAGFTSVQAVTINGSIDISNFGSNVSINKTANTVTFNDTSALFPGNAQVNEATGDFQLLVGSFVAYQNFTYTPLAVVNPIWALTAGGYSFDLASINTVDEAGVGLILTGTGTIHTPLGDAVGTWSFSADDANSDGKFTFSSQTATTATPDGGATAMLLGLGAVAMGAVSRRKA